MENIVRDAYYKFKHYIYKEKEGSNENIFQTPCAYKASDYLGWALITFQS